MNKQACDPNYVPKQATCLRRFTKCIVYAFTHPAVLKEQHSPQDFISIRAYISERQVKYWDSQIWGITSHWKVLWLYTIWWPSKILCTGKLNALAAYNDMESDCKIRLI